MKNQTVTRQPSKNITDWLKKHADDVNSEIAMCPNLRATFAQLNVGKGVRINVEISTESNVRACASRYSRKKGIRLACYTVPGLNATIVIREN